MAAQRTHTYQFQIALHPVYQHGQFVQPGFPEKPSGSVHTVVTGNLAAAAQSRLFIDIRLQVFRIGIHRPELVHTDDFTAFALPLQTDEQSARRLVVAYRFFHLRGNDVKLSVYNLLVKHIKPGTVQPPQNLDTRKRTVLPFRQPEIEIPGERELGDYPVPAIIQEEEDAVDDYRILPHYLLAADARCGTVAGNESPSLHAIVGIGKEGVDMPHTVERTPVDDEPGQAHFMRKHGFGFRRVHEHCYRRKRLTAFLYPAEQLRGVLRFVHEPQQQRHVTVLQ